MKQIKDVMKITGLTRRALQYYDDKGLMNVKRNADNYRIYENRDLQSLWEILVFKELGFKLGEIQELLAANTERKDELLRKHLLNIEEKFEELRIMYAATAKVVEEGLPEVLHTPEGESYKVQSLKFVMSFKAEGDRK